MLRAAALEASDPAYADTNDWFRCRSWVMTGAARELARRRVMADLTVGDVLTSWARAVVPTAVLAAVMAGIMLMLASKLGPGLPFTRQEIADMVGTTTETAIRVMSHLKDRGIIRSVRGKVIILAKENLRVLSEGPPRNSPAGRNRAA